MVRGYTVLYPLFGRVTLSDLFHKENEKLFIQKMDLMDWRQKKAYAMKRFDTYDERKKVVA